MGWHLKGQMVETCSCNMLCPCWFGVQELMIMDQGWCASALAWRIREGDSDGVALGGRDVVFAADFPGPTMFDGGATIGLFIDDGADAEQRRELDAIFRGTKGGPMENIAPLVSTWLPTRTAKVDVDEHGDSITVTVQDVGKVHNHRLRDPEGVAFSLRGGGFVTALYGHDVAELAPSASEWSDPQMPRSFKTRSGARGDFAWSG